MLSFFLCCFVSEFVVDQLDQKDEQHVLYRQSWISNRSMNTSITDPNNSKQQILILKKHKLENVWKCSLINNMNYV